MSRKKDDLTGMRFGHWTVLSEGPHIQNGKKITYICRCDCGTERAVEASNLRSGCSKSCGCIKPVAGRPRGSKRWLYMRVSADKYELPLDVDFSAPAIAKRWGIKANSVYVAAERDTGVWKRILVDDEEGL